MKTLLPSILLSLLSFPLAVFLRLLYFNILPPYGSGDIALLSCVISINVISLILGIKAVITNKQEK
ncbi:hypothetical protein [Brevibacillus sp. MS2.2]|uniref:hypothetical protein n=1 Tax=Brevibacillus sp. MS2.2 TaxID=2738981 RepID=UPI00156ADB77|nr:hypothetical protein [Brevibacillus sp. MS2.2]NRR21349.1 hypothetical protein [Brevibacillus sp. MS2.2]